MTYRLAAIAAWCLFACGPGTPPVGDDDAGEIPVDDAGNPLIDADDPIAPDAMPLPAQTARLRIVNNCDEALWIAHSDNVPFPQNPRLDPGGYQDYDIAPSGLASARFWPKAGCDSSGHNCRIGDTGEGGGAPCGANGCQPPIDSKFEATFAPIGGVDATFYNLSLVDGFTLPFKVTPLGGNANTGSCTESDCSMLGIDACPTAEDLGGDAYPQYADVDLRIPDVGCLSPCKAWNYPAPYGLGRSEGEDPGLHLCCPTPINPGTGNCTAANGCISPEACRATSDPLSVTHTDYVAVVHSTCPTAYAYSYDDDAGLHACSPETAFEVRFCP